MNLVIQGRDVATPDLKAIAKLARASGIEQITPTAFRLLAAQNDPAIAAAAADLQERYAALHAALRAAPLARRPSCSFRLVMRTDIFFALDAVKALAAESNPAVAETKAIGCSIKWKE